MSDPVQQILQEINRKAEEEAQKILDQANKEAERIIKEAEEFATKQFQHEAHSRLILLTRQILGKAEYEGRIRLLKAKDEIIKRLQQKVKERLKKIILGEDPGISYADILYRLLKEAVSNIPSDNIIIISNTRDREILERNLGKFEEMLRSELGRKISLKLSSDEVNCLGGIIAKSEDESFIYYNTLDGRLKEAFRKLRGRLNRLLFRQFLKEVYK